MASSGYETASYFGHYSRDEFSAELRTRLAPLIERLQEYDSLRARLEREGGKVSDADRLTKLLCQPVRLASSSGMAGVSLIKPERFNDALRAVGARKVYLSVRVRPSGFPSYYLVRAKHGYWSEYSLLVEDLYQSPDYPSPDERFVKLMDLGHETYFLRLSQFREALISQQSADCSEPDSEVDTILHNVGRNVFQAAWHEDQHPAFEAATHLGLPSFRDAIELLYLCLSGDLCRIRAFTDRQILAFFRHVYPQPAIRALLRRIRRLDGNALAQLPEQALAQFQRLSGAYADLLRVEVNHGPRNFPVQVYQLLYANFDRLDKIAPSVAEDPGIATARRRLERRARGAIRAIAGNGGVASPSTR
jgi:hypothetical protein